MKSRSSIFLSTRCANGKGKMGPAFIGMTEGEIAGAIGVLRLREVVRCGPHFAQRL